MTVANFSIATTDRIKGQDGQYTDKTEWHNLVAFQRTAEIIRDYVKRATNSMSKAVSRHHPGR